ncbi:MAG: DNA mismatch repair endonuclease MutL [Spirochaetes bacterium]|nr:DNA mismatch repair endonuclease MutL [Spirochaetota bacterium]
MGGIIVLPQEVSRKIAAGEVIEAPFSAVRELVDNAIDAGAARIGVVTVNGGKESILVTDDGSGMSCEDALLSIQKHTTSKIKRADDLLDVRTMGFRGEALSSICTVSDFSMVTRTPEAPHGTRVSCRFGKNISSKPEAANRGTAVTVRSLFSNLPARKKFLKSARTESARVKDEIVRKAVFFHRIGFSYKADDKTVFSLSPANDVRVRIGDIFGADVEKSLNEASADGEGYSLTLLVSDPSQALSGRLGQYFFVNGRPVSDRALFAAVGNPVRGYFPAGRYPHLFLFIDIEPGLVDVNVHPQKKEVKISVMQRLFSSVGDLTRQAFALQNGGSVYSGGGGNGRVPGFERLHERPLAGDLFSLSSPRQIKELSQQDSCFETVEREAFFPAALVFRGTLFRTYLLFEGEEDVLIVDQHAAHERVLYERFQSQKGRARMNKTLLAPIVFTPPGSCHGDLSDALECFHDAGIVIEPFGEDSFAVVELPGIVPEHKEEETISRLLEEFCAGDLRPDAGTIEDRFFSTAACRAAVKEGDALSEREAFRLLSDLAATRVPYMCPHGRPSVIRRSRAYIEKLFGRR